MLLRYERFFANKLNSKFEIITDLKGIKGFELKGKNLLLAIGSRTLNSTAKYYKDLGVNVFARIISTPESISKGFSSCVDNSKIAILNPSKSKEENLEAYLCKYWEIDYILCRDSSGYSQTLWENISDKFNIQLFLLKRPESPKNEFIFSKYNDLLEFIVNIKI